MLLFLQLLLISSKHQPGHTYENICNGPNLVVVGQAVVALALLLLAALQNKV